MSALCLAALPAAAQMERIGETVNSPFGAFRGGWAGALSGPLLMPSGALHAFAFPSWHGETPEAAAAPDDAVLRRLAPVAAALERSGVAPDEFKKLSPEAQAAKVAAILPESVKLVAEEAGRRVRRVDRLRGEKVIAAVDDALMTDIEDLLENYRGYLHLDEQTRSLGVGAFKFLLGRRDQRLVDRAQAVTRVAEIHILSGTLGNGPGASMEAVRHAVQLAATGEPDKSAHTTAVLLIDKAAEIERRNANGNDVAYDLNEMTRIASGSPFPDVQSLAVDKLLRRGAKSASIGDAEMILRIAHAKTIALASPSRGVKEEAISLLKREITGRYYAVETRHSAAAAIDAVSSSRTPVRKGWTKTLSGLVVVGAAVAILATLAVFGVTRIKKI